MVEVTVEDRATLESWLRATTTEQRLVLRARIILALARGQTNREVAEELSIRPATVSKWRTRFATKGIGGLADAPRSGEPPTYTEEAKRRRRVEFLIFMNQVVADYPEREIHVILDNLNTHKPKRDLWLARHPQVHFHFTPTHASWLNQVEVWVSVLTRAALQGASFTSPEQVRTAIEGFVAAYNPTAEPFQWRKREVKNTPLKKKYAELCR